METEKTAEKFVQNLLLVMPVWNSKLVRPFKDSLNGEMSLETYYCLETLKSLGGYDDRTGAAFEGSQAAGDETG